jgi:3'-5' exonuclease
MCAMSSVIVWDIETVPDIQGFASANGHTGKSDDEIRAAMGDKFPKHIYHSIICIGALVAHREAGGHWIVDALGAPHVGERSEKDLIASFVDKIAALSPQLVTFNGSSFDLPVLRYRAMVHGVAAPGLAARPYFHRYTEDAVDLCDVLSSFSSQAKATHVSGDGAAGEAGRDQRRRSGEALSRRPYPRDCGVLRERRAQHVSGVAPI